MKEIINKPELYMQSGEVCPIKVVTNLISGKWKILILWYLSQEKRRCGEIQRLLPSASKGVLSKQLNELVEDKLIIKTVYDEVPLKVEYSLSETGESFTTILEVLRVWGDDYINKYYK
jgi:DNA-binding HxlR family transcriptional regulator